LYTIIIVHNTVARRQFC